LRGEPSGWQAMRRLELDLAHAADATVATSAVEADLLARERVARVHVLPVVEPPARGDAPGWRARDGVVFLGNYAHEPNVDAAQRLCTAVMPLVWQRLPNLRVTLAGADPTLPVRALAGGNVAVTGFVEDAAELLARHRVFAAPIGFGAGVKGKIVYAMAHGIPVVTTAVGAEGIFVERDYDGVAASDEDAAERIVRLHEDESAWNALAARGGQVAEAFSPEAAGRALDALLERLYAD
jgi:glycosyltransferase involved in cell wall biosynthesis